MSNSQPPQEMVHPTPTTFTFSGGETVVIRRVSPILIRDFKRSLAKVLPEPRPPVQEVPRPDGTKGMEANTSHPDFLAAVQEYFEELGIRYLEFMAKHAVELDIPPEGLARLRKEAAEDGLELPVNDKVAWITRELIRTTQDMADFQELVLSTFQPTERGIQTKVDTFRPTV